jgi:hypothetical protein
VIRSTRRALFHSPLRYDLDDRHQFIARRVSDRHDVLLAPVELQVGLGSYRDLGFGDAGQDVGLETGPVLLDEGVILCR